MELFNFESVPGTCARIVCRTQPVDLVLSFQVPGTHPALITGSCRIGYNHWLMAGIVHVNASMRTDRGQVRDHNEDFVACYEPAGAEQIEKNGWLYILADGVGGADAGEVASRYALERVDV